MSSEPIKNGLDEGDIPMVAKLLAAGLTQAQVASLYNRSQTSVSKFVNKYNIPHNTKVFVDPIRLRECREEGLSILAAAERLGCSRHTVEKAFNELVQSGESERRRPKLTEDEERRIRHLRSKGLDQKTIARVIGRNPISVYRVLRKQREELTSKPGWELLQ